MIRRTALALTTLLLGTVSVTAAPATMRAMVAANVDGKAALQLQTLAVPEPKAGEVRIRIVAAAVNPVDLGIANIPTPADSYAAIPGQDVSGFIDAIGPGVTGFKIGDAVDASLNGHGGYAEYVAWPAEDVALKPKSFTFEQAAGMPTSGVAAWRALRESKLQKGQTIAIIGAAGGVGDVAVQMSKARGAHIIGIGAAWQDDYMVSLGADEVVNYDKDDVAAKVKNVDVVVSTVRTETDNGIGYLHRGGILVAVSGTPDADKCANAGVTCIHFIGQDYPQGPTKGGTLPELAKLADSGQYHIDVEQVFSLEQAVDAQRAAKGHTKGKIILDVSAEAKQH